MLKHRKFGSTRGQQGAALLTALAFLTIITIIAVVAMQSSNTQLRMANSQELKTAARQTAQSCIDSVINKPAYFRATGSAHAVTGVSITELTEFVNTTVTLKETVNMPPPRGIGTSSDKFNAAMFEVECKYDDTANGGGKDDLTQGFLTLTLW